jgi:hypothetical protein
LAVKQLIAASAAVATGEKAVLDCRAMVSSGRLASRVSGCTLHRVYYLVRHRARNR